MGTLVHVALGVQGFVFFIKLEERARFRAEKHDVRSERSWSIVGIEIGFAFRRVWPSTKGVIEKLGGDFAIPARMVFINGLATLLIGDKMGGHNRAELSVGSRAVPGIVFKVLDVSNPIF